MFSEFWKEGHDDKVRLKELGDGFGRISRSQFTCGGGGFYTADSRKRGFAHEYRSTKFWKIDHVSYVVYVSISKDANRVCFFFFFLDLRKETFSRSFRTVQQPGIKGKR
jgi:hypothetical protein